MYKVSCSPLDFFWGKKIKERKIKKERKKGRKEERTVSTNRDSGNMQEDWT
jgi:hypothetical protein